MMKILKNLIISCWVIIGTLQAETELPLYTIVERPEMSVIGIECKTSNASVSDILAHWKRFFSENIIPEIPNKASNELIALYCDFESDFHGPYSFVIGYPTTTLDVIPEGMVGKTIPAARYAQFSAIGDYPQSLMKTWQQIWTTDLDRVYTGDFEVYGEKYEQNPQEVDVYIAIN